MNKKQYLDRLYQWLLYKVEMGSLTEEFAMRVYTSAENYITTKRIKKIDKRYEKDLPYFKELVVGDWLWEESWNKAVSEVQAAKQKEFIQKYDTEASKREYLPQLLQYLDAAGLSADSKDPTLLAKRNSIITSTNQLIDAGIPMSELPNFEAVTRYIQAYKKEKQAIGLSNVGSMEWKREYETTVKPRLALMAQMQREAGEERNVRETGERLDYIRNQREGFDVAREQALTESQAPIDWIKKWQTEHALSPFEKEGTRTVFTPYGYGYQEPDTRTISPLEIPDIVQRFAPGVAFTGKRAAPLTNVGITTPSGQALGRMLPSQRESLQGYAQYSGQYWPDILAKTAAMLPQPLRGSNWRAARQRG